MRTIPTQYDWIYQLYIQEYILAGKTLKTK